MPIKTLNLTYFEEVLGVQEILLPESELEPEEKFNAKTIKHVKILFLSLEPFESAEQNLFDKIVAALKLPSQHIQHQILRLEQSFQENILADQIIFLGEPPQNLPFQNLKESFTQISSPEEMLKNPSLKRKAWESLQEVLQRL